MIATVLAYLDPGSSSMIVQMLLGGAAAAGVALKLYWRRVLRFLRLRKDPVEEPAGAATAAHADAEAPGRANGADTVAADGALAGREPVETSKR